MRQQIHDGVEITDSMICEGAVIKEGAIIESGCIVGFKVWLRKFHMAFYLCMDAAFSMDAVQRDRVQEKLEVPRRWLLARATLWRHTRGSHCASSSKHRQIRAMMSSNTQPKTLREVCKLARRSHATLHSFQTLSTCRAPTYESF